MEPTGLAPALLQELEAAAVELAQGAGRRLMERFRQPLEVAFKSRGERNPVTEADRSTEAFLRDGILARFPHHAVLGEEGSGRDSPPAEFTWALDPLDGTTNFLNGLPIFASSVGLLHRGSPVVGAIFIPWVGEPPGLVFHARRGGGAFAQGARLQVASHREPQPTGLVGAPVTFHRRFAVGRWLWPRLGELRGTGSMAYELAMVAGGTMQYAVFAAPHLWDVAAGVVLVREAGGVVLARQRRRWESLEGFAAPGGAPIPGQEELRRWRAPLLVGGPELLRVVAPALRPRSRWVRHWLRRLRGGAARSGATGRRSPPHPALKRAPRGSPGLTRSWFPKPAAAPV